MGARDQASHRLSVSFLSPGWPVGVYPNGIITYVHETARQLRELGHAVTIFSLLTRGDWDKDTVCPVDLPVERSLSARGPDIVDRALWRIAPQLATDRKVTRRIISTARRAIQERGIEVLEMEETFGHFLAVSRALRIPVCLRLHGPWFLNGQACGMAQDDTFRHRVAREGEAIKAAVALTAPSQDVLDRTRAFYDLELPDAEVVSTACEPIATERQWRLQDCDPRQLLFVGRFDRHKGGDLVIDAFARLLQLEPDARLWFVGPDSGLRLPDGRVRKIEEYIRERIPGALERGLVQWLGVQHRDRIPELRRRAMLTLVCSRYETLGYTALENLACGCPQVASRTGGIKEVVRDNVNGLLYQPEDVDDMVSKILTLMRNPQLAAQLGKQGADDCRRMFGTDVIAARMVDFYRRVLKREGSRSAVPAKHWSSLATIRSVLP